MDLLAPEAALSSCPIPVREAAFCTALWVEATERLKADNCF
jgi:hypothetical protein